MCLYFHEKILVVSLQMGGDNDVVIVTSYETAMRTAYNFLTVFLKKSVLVSVASSIFCVSVFSICIYDVCSQVRKITQTVNIGSMFTIISVV